MMIMYAIFMDGMLLEKFETPEEAYQAAIFGYEETGIFHEVKAVGQFAKTIND